MGTQEIIIPTSTIINAILIFAGVYIVSPAAMIVRDFLILRMTKTFILNKYFWDKMEIMQMDKAYLDIKYNKNWSCRDVPESGDGGMYEIDCKKVSKEEFDEYKRQFDFHKRRYRQNYNALIIRNNLINRIFKYYKLEDYLDAIRKDADSKYDRWVNHLTKDEFWESHKHTRV
ncbi:MULTISPECIES: hypothetical protein [Enterobacteriaceae]|uniref:Uncharacterized protein n=3 Tax=Klebsiella/Raoultella group TaxID=2890311 RepID=A0A291VMP2_RAOPL|nr:MULTISPECIES: hypothetical protein [Enterobacteriaceae]ARB25642.1 hypothetical protein AM394_31115 [Klebsiella oxytoca]ECA6427924.1 hypothetical protein [Salmonella enterica subsp. enterica serovar Typhimurium]EIY4984985.1 hypothetical protein [Klebsiella quasipneumoniae]ATM18887.1 hypothetical protein CRN15_29440 [Raoultella planticola]ATM24151.1 hypothetical protein CRN13_27740 [Raoultella ornithinolytica]